MRASDPNGASTFFGYTEGGSRCTAALHFTLGTAAVTRHHRSLAVRYPGCPDERRGFGWPRTSPSSDRQHAQRSGAWTVAPKSSGS